MDRIIRFLTPFSLALLLGVNAFSWGMITLNGQYLGQTHRTFHVKVNGKTYILHKSHLTESQVDYFKTLKARSPASVDVPVDAIATVKDSP